MKALDPSGLLQLRTSGADNRSTWTFRQSSKRPSAGAAFTVRNVPGKGMGMFAARDIEPGERIIAEKPLARWAVRTSATREERIRSFAEVVVDFSAEQKAKLLGLSEASHYGKIPGKRTLMGTWLTNALPINYEDGQGSSADMEEAAVFETICRINHSCLPSCHHEWNPSIGADGMETVHALRAIAQDEELSISYLMPAGRLRAERQQLLSSRFGFECRCPLCSLDGEARARSDSCQREIGDVSTPDFHGLALPDLLKRLNLRLSFLAREGLPEVWARPLLVAAMVQSMQDRTPSGREKSKELAARASACVRLSAGEDHPNYATVSTFIQVVERFESQHGGSAGLAAALAAGGGRG